MLEVAKFPRFFSVPSFRLGIASRSVGALTHKLGQKLNIHFNCRPYSSKLEKPFAPQSRYHPSWRASGVRFVNFPFLRRPLDFWRKSHAKRGNLTLISLITSDQRKKLKIALRHDLDISINYTLTQCGPQMWRFARAIKIFVKSCLLSRKSRDVVGSCMSPGPTFKLPLTVKGFIPVYRFQVTPVTPPTTSSPRIPKIAHGVLDLVIMILYYAISERSCLRRFIVYCVGLCSLL